MQKAVGNEPKKRLIAERVLARVRVMPELKKFYTCFGGWVKGAGISEEDGMYLLADNTSGCQTALVRYGSGVALLHTEEDYYDVKARMQKVHTIEFQDQGRRLLTLVYNDLMPGAGLYGWQSGMIVAVDSLFLREDGIEAIEKPMLANIIAWLVWQSMPEEAEAKELIAKLAKLGTLVDGYAINVAVRTKEKVKGYKLTFAREEWECEHLWEQPGDNLRQVNIIEPRYARAKKPVAVWRHAPWKMYLDYRGFLARLRVMKEHIQAGRRYWTQGIPEGGLRDIHSAIQGQIFGRYAKAYVSEWMGAGCVGLVDLERGTSVSTKLNNGGELGTLEYLVELE